MPTAKNGTDRGLCSRPSTHSGYHANDTCRSCGDELTASNSYASRKTGGHCCIPCHKREKKIREGQKDRNCQIPNSLHTFPCGCIGVLPALKSANQFARSVTRSVPSSPGFICRVGGILSSAQINARRSGYMPIPIATLHVVIRQLMAVATCWLCKEPLIWPTVYALGHTPHLHHNHETGEIYGFTHPKCNPRALEKEIEMLRSELRRVK